MREVKGQRVGQTASRWGGRAAIKRSRHCSDLQSVTKRPCEPTVTWAQFCSQGPEIHNLLVNITSLSTLSVKSKSMGQLWPLTSTYGSLNNWIWEFLNNYPVFTSTTILRWDLSGQVLSVHLPTGREWKRKARQLYNSWQSKEQRKSSYSCMKNGH